MTYFKCQASHESRKKALLTSTEQGVWDWIDEISKDISLFHSCDTYYCEEHKALGDDYYEEFKSIDMLVIFMALNLEDNSRALSVDLKYAIENNIPVLPLAMENSTAKRFKACFGDNILKYIDTELLCAKHYIRKNDFKFARNALWRAIKECKTNGGYGVFIDNNRIIPYADLYITLGDAFMINDDLKQAEECYNKSIEALNFYEKEIENPSKEEALRAADCWLRLANVFFSDTFHFYIYYKALNCVKHAMVYVDKAEAFEKDDNTALYRARFELMRAKIFSSSPADEKQMSIFKNNLYVIEELAKKNKCEELFLQLCREYTDAGKTLIYRSAFDGATVLLQNALALVDSCPFYVNEDRLEWLRGEINTKLGVLSSLQGNEKLCEVYCLDAIDTLTEITEKYKDPNFTMLLAEAYITCSNIDKYYGRCAVNTYKSLYRMRPNTYRDMVIAARRNLFKQGQFRFFDYFWIKLHFIEKDASGFMVFENKKTKCRHRLYIIIDGELPKDEIETINIDECVLDELDGMRYENPSPLRVKPKLPSNEEIPPDELIHIVFKSGPSGMYLRLYG